MKKVVLERGMTLVTFLTSCAALALLLAAMTTQHWVVGRAHRKMNTTNLSDGRIHFGLFHGSKSLNVGYGRRTYDMNVVQLLTEDKSFLIFGLWLTTVVATCTSILLAIVAAVFALVNTVTRPLDTLTGIPGLYLWNSLALLTNLVGVVSWGVQYHVKFRANILSVEDRENLWSSEGLAVLGHSFWFVLAAAFIHLLNIALLALGSHKSGHRTGSLRPIVQDKGNGAIMLY